jgi:hypothetical protein
VTVCVALAIKQVRLLRLSSTEELDMLRQQIGKASTTLPIDPEIRGIVARKWPHLLEKLPPEKD